MTTYDGKGYNYVPGRDPPNKEPPVSKYVIEKLYRVHRERLQRVEPLVDHHVHIPEFMTNTKWKDNIKLHKAEILVRHNEEMAHRLQKVENATSEITKEIRFHQKKISEIQGHNRRLREQDRLRKILRIQKDNEHMLKRIERARPEYTLKSMKDWYKYHIHFKEGRRTEPTAGHIMSGMEGLTPKSLPPLSQSSISMGMSFLSSVAGESTLGTASVYSLGGRSLISQNTPPKSKSAGGDGSGSPTAFAPIMFSGGAEIRGDGTVPTGMGSMHDSHSSDPFNLGHARGPHKHDHEVSRSHEFSASLEKHDAPSKRGMKRAQSMDSHSLDKASLNHNHPAAMRMLDDVTEGQEQVVKAEEENKQTSLESVEEDDDAMLLLISRPFPLPYEAKNCVVQIYVTKVPDDYFYVKVVSPGKVATLLYERMVHVSKVTTIVKSTSNLAQTAAIHQDVQALRTVLINMFKEADVAGNGFLTFDEFQELMERVDLGISSQEMRFVISEADENEDGVVDYNEFIALAVDMIQSFRARNKAKAVTSQNEIEIDELIEDAISEADLDHITEVCLHKLKDADPKGFGVLKVNDLRRVLTGSTNGVTDKEVSMLCQMLPRDPFGRCLYGTLREVIGKIRFITMKNNYLESQGSNLLRYLLEMCREEETRLRTIQKGGQMHSDDVDMGLLPFRAVTNLLMSSPRLSMSRLQVMVIMAEANVHDGMVNYNHFMPIAAKTIEIMCEPKALRQRAELIEKTDLSAEALLKGMSTEEFEQKLTTLFRSYDVDRSGLLDKDEFRACLESLDFHIPEATLNSMLIAASLSKGTELTFDDFMKFFRDNLLELEREKHIQMLQQSVHAAPKSKMESFDGSVLAQGGHASAAAVATAIASADTKAEKIEDFHGLLMKIFKLADPQNKGYLAHKDFEKLLESLQLDISKFQLECLLSELPHHEELIKYEEFIPICAELLTAYQARQYATFERERKEQWAQRKANKIVKASAADIQHILRYLKDRIRIIEETVEDFSHRVVSIHEIIRNPHSGLSRSEANQVIGKLFTHEAIASRFRFSFRPVGHHHTAHTHHGDTKDHHGAHSHHHDAKDQPPHGSHGHHGTHTDHADHSQGHQKDSTHKVLMSTKSESDVMPKLHKQHSVKVIKKGVQHALHPLPEVQEVEKYSLSTHDLKDVIVTARKTSIMRALLEEVDHESVQSLLLHSLEKVALELKAEGAIPAHSDYLPVSVCYSSLEKAPSLHLNKAQMMAIMSWIDVSCYDETGTCVDFRMFAEFTAGVLSKMRQPDAFDDRAKILGSEVIDDATLLQGLTEEDLHGYLEDSFSQVEDENGCVSNEHCLTVLSMVPRVGLSRNDAVAISSSFEKSKSRKVSESSFVWRDFLPWSFSTILSFCRERAIAEMMTRVTDEEKKERDFKKLISELKEVGSNLMEYVKIKQQGDSVSIVFPGDNTGRKSSMIKNLPALKSNRSSMLRPSTKPSEGDANRSASAKDKAAASLTVPSLTESSNKNDDAADTDDACDDEDEIYAEVIELARCVKMITTVYAPKQVEVVKRPPSTAKVASVKTPVPTPAPAPSATPSAFGGQPSSLHLPSRLRNAGELPPLPKMPVLLRVIAVDSLASADKDLYVNAISVDPGVLAESYMLKVRLPTLAMVDKDTAQLFCMNIIDKIQIEVPHPHNPVPPSGPPPLRMLIDLGVSGVDSAM